MMEALKTPNSDFNIVKYAQQSANIIESHIFLHDSAMEHPTLTNKVYPPIFSVANNVMQVLPTQNSDGDILKYANELLTFIKKSCFALLLCSGTSNLHK